MTPAFTLLAPVPTTLPGRRHRLTCREITRGDVRAGVAAWHRHLPQAPPGEMARFGVFDVAGVCHGVTSIGRPLARAFDDGSILEVTRVATDGTYNACSALYGACRRWARKSKASRLLTYTLASEPGTSLRAAGWVEDEEYRGARRTSWASDGRPRKERTGEVAGPKRRWWMEV